MNLPDRRKRNTIASAAVERIDGTSVRICWESREPVEVAVYRGSAPDVIDRSNAAALSDDGCVCIRDLDPGARHYFELSANGDRMVTAERRVQLAGSVNFRDLGGYETVNGARVKWGHAFRADGLSRLSDADLALLKRIGIRRVYDFRTKSEIMDAPDRLPEDGSMEHVHMPITHGKFDFVEAVKRLQKGDTSWLTPDFMVKGYINNLEQYGAYWGTVIRHLAEMDGVPMVFHCTGGKDRTGTCAALVLLALGVPAETVIDDHQLSNIYIAELLPKFYEMMEGFGVDPEKLFPYLTAPRDCIIAVLDYLMEAYGSAESYLIKKGGLSPEVIGQLRGQLLE